jgi:hypothetical protein
MSNEREEFLQQSGAIPPKLAVLLKENQALKLPETVKAKRAYLMQRLALTYSFDDKHAVREIMFDVRNFNEEQRAVPIDYNAVLNAAAETQQ